MTYNGKEVITKEAFSYENVHIGDYVEQSIVDDAMNILPPACWRSDCAQIGEPYEDKEDKVAGRYRATYATFKRVTSGNDGIWEYCGHCFRGENKER